MRKTTMRRRSSSSGAYSRDSDSDIMSPISPVYDNPNSNARGAFAFPSQSKQNLNGTRTGSLLETRMANLTPGKARFRAAALKIIHMQRSSTQLQARVGLGVGAEPGVDARRHTANALYGHIRETCDIQVIDYSSVRSESHRFRNDGLRAWLAGGSANRPKWARCRWIHVDGMSWDVLSTLSVAYQVHPLALEDILHSHGQSRSKASYYASHLFLRLTAHAIAEDDEEVQDDFEPHITDLPRTSSPVEMDEVEETDSPVRRTLYPFRGRSSTFYQGKDVESRGASLATNKLWQNSQDSEIVDRRAARAQLQAIKSDEHRLPVELNNLFVMFWRDGTVISVYSKRGDRFAAPIMARLRSRETILRSTADPSLLVESMIDLVVDQTLEVIDSYHDQLTRLESVVLVRPKIAHVRALHVLEGDLALRKRSLEPLRSVVYGLRRYDLDRCVALAASAEYSDSDTEGTETELDDTEKKKKRKKKKKARVVGFMSHKAKIYLADVNDHLDYILSSVDLFTNITESLINYIFNMTSAFTNETMRILTLVTIIFLPLTVLSGYFGMNFTEMKVIEGSDMRFWYIAVPVLCVLIPIFLGNDIVRFIIAVHRKTSAKKVASAIREGRLRRKRPFSVAGSRTTVSSG